MTEHAGDYVFFSVDGKRTFAICSKFFLNEWHNIFKLFFQQVGRIYKKQATAIKPWSFRTGSFLKTCFNMAVFCVYQKLNVKGFADYACLGCSCNCSFHCSYFLLAVG